MATRALEFEELDTIIKLCKQGFKYEDDNGKLRTFRPNRQVALALFLEASLGLRISDILQLKVGNFQKGRLDLDEIKTTKAQYREINPELSTIVLEYAYDNGIGRNEKIFNIDVKAVQKQLRIIKKHLGLRNIGTHSFRKYYATEQFKINGNNIDLVKELLNHSSITTTQVYIKTTQEEIDKASRDFFVGNLMG